MLLLSPASSQGQSGAAVAQAHFDEGRAHYEAERFDTDTSTWSLTEPRTIPGNPPSAILLPTQQVLEILRNSRSFALAKCLCRSTHKRCDNPLEVCFYTNDVADKMVDQGSARRVDLEEAAKVLKLANEYGLIHLTIYNPEQHVYALCSCCECCCHDIGFMKKLGRPDLVAHADYVAVVDTDACLQCGACTERCVFGAQSGESGAAVFHQDKCHGCGLCVSTCASNAIRMVLRADR
jgi:Pyruvate/2-oxoacid:ferredoxin oxidoreductase delta subunit